MDLTKFVKKIRKTGARWLLLVLPLFIAWLMSGADVSLDPKVEFDEETLQCLECHGAMRYTLVDPETGDTVSMKMYEELRIDLMYMQKQPMEAFPVLTVTHLILKLIRTRFQ